MILLGRNKEVEPDWTWISLMSFTQNFTWQHFYDFVILQSAYDISADESEFYFGITYNDTSSNTADSLLLFDTETGDIKTSLKFENLKIFTLTVSMDYEFLFLGGMKKDTQVAGYVYLQIDTKKLIWSSYAE